MLLLLELLFLCHRHRHRHRHHRQEYKYVQQLLVKLLFTEISLLSSTTPFSLPPPIATS